MTMSAPPPSLERLIDLTTDLKSRLPGLAPLLPDIDQALASASEHTTSSEMQVYVLGTIKSGKSTLVSAFIGQDVLPRGSGVKTFNITRICRGLERQAVVRFKTVTQLAAMIRFDLRMLGYQDEVPQDLYSLGAAARLAPTVARLEQAMREDGRLARIQAAEEGSLLLQAWTRLGHVVAALHKIETRFGQSIFADLATHASLSFAGPAFERYLDWANTEGYAALIQEIELTLSFPETWPAGLTLVDCQGSDSLNPLDFAAVDAALHRADRVLYVVSSRLGLRQADQHLIRHLADSGLASKTAFVFNVEAFEPMPEAEAKVLTGKMQNSLMKLGIADAAIYEVSALHALNRQLSPKDTEVVESLWAAKGHSVDCQRLTANFQSLLLDLARRTHEQGAGVPDQASVILRARLYKIAAGLLDRDQTVYGVQGTELTLSDVESSVRRIILGECAQLQKSLHRLAHEAYDAHGPVQAAVDEFLKAGADGYAESKDQPETLTAAVRHGEIMAAALELFNRDWMLLDQKLKVNFVHPLLERALQEIRRMFERLHKILPATAFGSWAEHSRDAVPTWAFAKAAIEKAADHFRTQTDVPETLSPVLLVPHLASGLAAEFYARHWLAKLKSQWHGRGRGRGRHPAKGEVEAPQLAATDSPSGAQGTVPPDREKITTLWQRSLKAAFRAGRQDQEFSVSSARENLKFQYLSRLLERATEAYEACILAGIRTYFDDLSRLEQQRNLLLSGEERARLEAWLRQLSA